MTSLSITPNPSSIKTDDDDDDNTSNSVPSSSNSKLDIEQSETRSITISEAIGLDFNSFIPQADITSQVHFVSNIQLGSQVDLAGLKDGDRRILQVNGINVTNLEHEDVRKLMQLMTPIILTVANDPKYLLILQQPVVDIEEKLPGNF
ncbi:unnamed protein product [Rotaria sp. Silwood2]|nr:unnamed protein product [Rotaria sp. Silwood2]CAF2583772.1 unnamed protein product [Rotaria sp. Silwood2]CAF4366673.1 unnamed protein product [Rotaria sp. Silwood2]